MVGDVLGKYHPHSDTAAYDTLVRLAQWFSLRYPLVDGQGNFGNQDGYGAAAMRYTECRLQKLAVEMLRDIDADTVDFVPNYDGRHREPTVLPSRFPNLLVNGSAGIAVGMATNIPPHNLGETIDAAVELIDNPDATLEDIMQHIKGPDFPTAASVMGIGGIRDAYATGRGRVVMRAKVHTEEQKGGRNALIVTELPYMVKKGGDDGVITKVAELIQAKVLTEISDINDDSDHTGTRIRIELKRDAIPMVALNKLFKHTALQTTFGVNMVALVDGVPRTLSLRQMLVHYLDHQKEVVTRRTKFELDRAERRAHVLEGYLIALDNLDAVIALIRGADDTDTARHGLMEQFGLSEIQAQAILDMRLRALTGLERKRVKDEHADLLERIAELRAILADEARLMALIREELLEIRDQFADERRTEILPAEGEIDLEQLIAEEDMVISITRSGYIKRLALVAVPRPGPRRDRRDRDGHQGGRLHRAPVRRLHARLPAVLHVGREGLPDQGARASHGEPPVQGPRARERPAAAPGRAGDGGDRDARLRRGPLPALRHPQGHRQEDRVQGLRHRPQGRRHHRAQDPRRRRADRRAPDRRRRRRPHGVAKRPGGAVLRGRRAPDGPGRVRRRRG